jgi:hypothetical protein
MPEDLCDDAPEASIIKTYEGKEYRSYLMNSVDFVRIHVEPAIRKVFRERKLEAFEPFYENLKFFTAEISIPETNEVVFQLNHDGYVVSF